MRPVSSRWSEGIGQSHELAIEVTLEGGDGSPIPVVSGSVTLDITAETRGRCDLTFADLSLIPRDPDSLLAPYSNELRVRRGLVYPDGERALVSLGVFRIEETEIEDGPDGTQIRVSGLDRSARIIDAAFEEPYSIAGGTDFLTAIEAGIRAAYGSVEIDFAAKDMDTPTLKAEEGDDRWAFFQTMAAAIGMDLYFDNDGVLKLAPIPEPAGDPVAHLIEGSDDVEVLPSLLTASKKWTRTEAHNRWIVTGDNPDTGGTPPRAVATDDDPNSPTYYFGPFGPKPDFYCADEETEILTRAGWKHHEELRAGEDVLTLNIDRDESEWQPAERINRFPVKDEVLVSLEARGHSSLTTPNHRWPVENYNGSLTDPKWNGGRWTTTARLGAHQRLYAAAPVLNGHPATLDDALVELVAWYWTEGNDRKWNDHLTGGVYIYQSRKANSAKCDRIVRCLERLFGPASGPMRSEDSGPKWWEDRRPTGVSIFRLNRHAGRRLQALAPEKVPSAEFLCSLTPEQLRLFWEVSLLGDGTQQHHTGIVTQRYRHALDSLQMACSLAGLRSNLYEQGYRRDMWNLSVHKCARPHIRTMRREEVPYSGVVWCPTTENSTWLARRNGTVYYTGNSSSFIETAEQAQDAANGRKAKEIGTSQSVDFGAIVNPALEPGDVVQITRTRPNPSGGDPIPVVDEAHIIDSLTLPLTAGESMTGTTRARRIV